MRRSKIPEEEEKLHPLSPTAVKEKQAKLAAAFDTKLKFDSIRGLVGREKEIATLKDCLDRILVDNNTSNATAKKELILLGGQSGTGKTSLALTLKDPVRRLKNDGAFVSAKYDDSKAQDVQPYSGFINVCNELCKLLLKRNNDDDRSLIRQEIVENIDESQLHFLQTIVPMLSTLLFTSPGGTDDDDDDNEVVKPENDASQITTEPQQQQHQPKGRRRSFLRKRTRNRGTASEGGSIASNNSNDTWTTYGTDAMLTTPMDPKAGKAALQLAFGRLLGILTSRFKDVVVILLDDLQWADESSVELIESIFKRDGLPGGSATTNIMLIGCYRSDEVDEGLVFSKMVQNIRAEGGENDDACEYPITELSVGNFDLESVDIFIRELLNVPEATETMGLSTICHKRTLGNVYFVKVFLTSLQEASLLVYNINVLQWKWDEAEIDVETAATENLIDLLLSKMKKLSEELLMVLKIAACLGHEFPKSILSLLWESRSQMIRDTEIEEEEEIENLDDLLQAAVSDLFLETTDNESYRFVHDKVQEAASLLIPVDERLSFRENIGMMLYNELDEEEVDRMIFVIVSLLNGLVERMDEPSDTGSNPEVAALNLKAAVKSMELSAFFGAARYARFGVWYLGDQEIWSDNVEMRLQLYTIGARAEIAAGNDEKSNWYCERVLKQDSVSVYEKASIVKLTTEYMHRHGMYEEYWALTTETLHALGFRYPKNHTMRKLKALSYLGETKKRYLPTPEEVADMPFVSDRRIQATVLLLVNAAEYANTANDMTTYTLAVCDSIRITKKHGLTEFTGSSFCSFANVLMHQNGDWSAARRTAETALAIQERSKSNYTKTSTLLKPNYLVLGWVTPLKGCWAPLMEAYRLGLRSGNIEGGILGLFYALICQLYTGTPLPSLAADFTAYLRQIEALKAVGLGFSFRLLLQIALNFMGDESNPCTTELKGTAAAQLPFRFPPWENMYIAFTCAYFGEHKKGAELALENSHDEFYKRFLGAANFGFLLFPQALCLYAHARVTRKRKFLQAARRGRRTLEKWVRKGGVNYVHQLQILNAEDAAWRGKESEAKQNYGDAIRTAARSGFTQDAALANERYSLYLSSMAQDSDAQYYMTESIRYYREWGAQRKVSMLMSNLEGT